MAALLSICIPTWNRADSLRKTLESLKEALRSVPDNKVEVCISDNHSPDHTQLVISDFKLERHAIKLVRQSENIGFSGNFWSVVRLANSEFTWVTGDDDLIDSQGLIKLVGYLESHKGDLLLINNAPWKKSTNELPEVKIESVECYLKTLGLFHASFIGNTVYRTSRLLSMIIDKESLDSAYPHMAPILACLLEGDSRFFNIKTALYSDTLRSWKVRQPLYSSIDMARVITENAFSRRSFKAITKIKTYYILMRSLPRTAFLVQRKKISIDPKNPYQDISARNIKKAYRSSMFMWPAACVIFACACLVSQFMGRCNED